MKRLIAFALLLTACSTPIAAPIVSEQRPLLPNELERYSAEYTATAEAVATSLASTATAVPAIQTVAAVQATQTAAAIGVTQTHMVETPTAAAIAMLMTESSSGGTSTAIANMNYGNLSYYATATEVKAQAAHNDWARSVESVTQTSLMAAALLAPFGMLTLIALAIYFLAVILRGKSAAARFIIVNDKLFDATQRRYFLPNEVVDPEPPHPQNTTIAEVLHYECWKDAILDAARLAGLVGGWSVSLMCEQFPADARPISEDDRERVVEVLIDAGVLAKGRGNQGTDYAEGESFMTLRQAVESGRLRLPPHSPTGKKPPEVDISLAQRDAPQRTTQTLYKSPMKRRKEATS